MDNFFIKMFQRREATKSPVPGVPSSTTEQSVSVNSGSFGERIVYARSPQVALTVSAVYRATELRARTMAAMPVQYRRKDPNGGNFTMDMRGMGKRLNYLLQEQANPVMSAPDLWQMVTINQLMYGNGFVYIERDVFGNPYALWLVKEGGYNIVDGTYNFTYLGERGYVSKVGIPRSEVMHFPNTFRYNNGFWGISTLQFALETLSLNKTLKAQTLETAAKGGRVKLIIGEEKPTNAAGTLAFGMLNKDTMQNYAKELQDRMYAGQDILAIRGLDKIQPISMSASEMQAAESLGLTYDDISRFYATPRPLLMLDTNSHYNDYQNATMEYHTRTILPEKISREKEIARKLVGLDDYGFRDIHICEKPLLAMDPERKAKVAQLRLQAGLSTVNELRAEDDMPAVPDGNIVYISTNLAELGSAKLRDTAVGRPGEETANEEKNN